MPITGEITIQKLLRHKASTMPSLVLKDLLTRAAGEIDSLQQELTEVENIVLAMCKLEPDEEFTPAMKREFNAVADRIERRRASAAHGQSSDASYGL